MSRRVNILLQKDKVDFVLFTTSTCPFCHKAKNLLSQSNHTWKSHDVRKNQKLQMEVIQMTGQRTVPAVFDTRGETPQFIGGFDDLHEFLRIEFGGGKKKGFLARFFGF
ncbi:MAG: glutaredoxin [Euryarchaeota archaeon]|jgi:glutaredoxin 3|nr:glutaredoxin [Euryarchaeota archaeon]MBT3970777.1 glutaredoxin [Euryarchaeota archaeon]MBT6644468.1 glutaredoxin [Euryarchaeota archaeon]